ncbi:MAG: hypothetical protein AB1469_02785 [Pseudomonadota bacterium]
MRTMRDKHMRQRIAMEAARLMAEHGVRDYYAAKRKAAAQLGASATQNMPRNEEIEQELGAYQRLFQTHSQPRRLRALRVAALQAMRLFAVFDARLVGSVLSGTAHAHSDVSLHVFTDTPEEVGLLLMQNDIPYETVQHHLRLAPDSAPVGYPGYRFMAGDTVIDLTVFPLKGIRQAPRSPVDGKPMRRADLSAVTKLLQEESND